MNNLFEMALGITNPWFIKSIESNKGSKRLDIEIDFNKGSTLRDSNEGTEPKEYKAYDTVRTTWRHLNFF